MSDLTKKQQLFIEYYLQSFNGTQAAMEAGYQGNDNTLSSVAYENLRKPEIQAAIDERFATVAMSTDEILYHLTNLARKGDSKTRLSALVTLAKLMILPSWKSNL